jgi:hypothetical protein
MQFGVKVKGHIDTNLSRDTPLSPDTSSHQISTKNLQSFRNNRAEGKYYAIWGQGQIDTNLLRDTPLSSDTSSHQISTKNLQSFRRYRVEGNFSFKVNSRIDTILSREVGHGSKNIKHPPNLRWQGCLIMTSSTDHLLMWGNVTDIMLIVDFDRQMVRWFHTEVLKTPHAVLQAV